MPTLQARVTFDICFLTMEEDIKSTSPLFPALPQLQLTNISRQDVLDYFKNGWDLTELLFSGLKNESSFMKPPSHGLRHPLIFYYGHPATLYINKLRVAGIIEKPVNEYFENIFEVGVDEMSWDDMSKNEMSWPRLQEVKDYRKKVYDLIEDLILEHPQLDPQKNSFTQDSQAWALVMGFEHERIHLETSSVLMRELPLSELQRPSAWPALAEFSSESVLTNSFTTCLEKNIVLGKERNTPSFGWDNEYGSRSLFVPEFAASKYLTTNQEFLEFVKEGGYSMPSFWSEQGWQWRSYRNTKHPTFWIPEGPAGLHQYRLRTLFEVVDFQADWPAIVNFHEAKAFCAWKKKNDSEHNYRLLTEAEHHALRPLEFLKIKANLNLVHGSECSVSKYQHKNFYDVFGNVWQWCEDTFNPLEGFKAHRYYEDFSTPCFDGRHQMIMGGSFISTGDEATPYARFHFRPHFFQHAGFRIVKEPRKQAKKNYESSDLLSQYLLLHYGTAEQNLSFPNLPQEALFFPKRCAQLLSRLCHQQSVPTRKALDIGCAVGGSSFSLSENFENVLGIDLSSQFIEAANQIKVQGSLLCHRQDQGDISSSFLVKRPPHARIDNVEFIEADACNLPLQMRGYDAVLVANLLCRLPDPKKFLLTLTEEGFLNPNGIVLLVSPYSWLKEHTHEELWLGGKSAELRSEKVIQDILSPHFHLLHEEEMPVIIREHERKYQLIISHAMAWQKK